MLGKRKIVAMHEPKTLLAPTPNFDSHICEERPDLKEKESLQYIKSLVYLYEFANGNLDPVIRPRHCCPIAALIFKNIPSYETLDIVGSESSSIFSTSYQSPLSLLKPVSQHVQPSFWGRQFPQSEFKKSSINVQKNDEDPRKIVVGPMEKELYDIENPTSADEAWRPANYGHQNEVDRDLFALPKGVNRYSDSMFESTDRERSPERNKKWNESISRGIVRSSRGFESSLRISARGSKTWFK